MPSRRLDVVLLSHNHYDHLDRLAVKHIARANPAGGLGRAARPRRLHPGGGAPREIVELDWWQQTAIKGLGVMATPARHFSGRGLGDRNRSLWCGFALETEKHRALFVGDTAYHPEFGAVGSRCGPFDLVMIPIGAYDPRWFMRIVHTNPEEAVQIYQDLVTPHRRQTTPAHARHPLGNVSIDGRAYG